MPKKQQTGDRQIIRCNTVEVQFSSAEEQAKLQAELRELAREIVSGLSALEPTQSKELLNSFVSELFASAAEQEHRKFRRQKQSEGIALAKAAGVRFGPLPRTLPDNFEVLRQAWRSRQMSLRAAAEACGIPKSTFRDAAIRVEMAASCAKAE